MNILRPLISSGKAIISKARTLFGSSVLAIKMVYHDSKIIIVGGGVFGLSTALWLARSGYENITVFDRCPLDKKHYDPSDGCDRASADINKIFRMAYGDKQTSAPPDVLTRVQRHIGLYSYQDLAIEARDIWLSWNEDIARSSLTTLPDGELLYECGCYFLAKGPELREFFQASLDTMGRSAPEIRRMQFVKVRPLGGISKHCFAGFDLTFA